MAMNCLNALKYSSNSIVIISLEANHTMNAEDTNTSKFAGFLSAQKRI